MSNNFFALPTVVKWRNWVSVGMGLLSMIYVIWDYRSKNYEIFGRLNPNYIPFLDLPTNEKLFVLFIGVFVTGLALFIFHTAEKIED